MIITEVKNEFVEKRLEWAKSELILLSGKDKMNDEEMKYIEEVRYDHVLKAFEKVINLMYNSYFENPEDSRLLNKLISFINLTPIKEDDEWISLNFSDEKKSLHPNGAKEVFVCKRRKTLFKYIFEENIGGSDKPQLITKYTDLDRVVFRTKKEDVSLFDDTHLIFVTNLMDEKFPIEFPYNPENQIIVNGEKFLCEKDNSWIFDTFSIISCLVNDKEYIINRFFKEDHKTGKFKEIDEKEFIKRRDGYHEQT